MPAPPWPLAADDLGARDVLRRDAPSAEVFPPLLYGRQPAPEVLASLQPMTGPLPLALRLVDDVVLPGQGLVVDRQRGAVLPLSLKGDIMQRPEIFRTGLATSPPQAFRVVDRADGPVIVADQRHDEFGHRLLELAPRLLLSTAAPDELPVVTGLALRPDLLAMGRAVGIAPERWRRFRRPLFAPSAYWAEPPLRLWRPVHPLAFEAFARIARLGAGVGTDLPERLYLSRRGIARRRLRNEAEIEAIFAAHGFTVVQPEAHPFELQVAMAANARLIAGPAGSAMHLAVLAPSTTRVLILSSPRSFDLTEPYLNPAAGRLGLVFGTLAPDADGKPWAPWQIDAADVHAGIAGHLGLGHASPPSA